QALDRDGNNFEAMRGVLALKMQAKQPAEAARIVQAQLAKFPENSGFYFLLGQVQQQNKQPAQAEAALQKATDLNPNNVEAFLLLAQLQTEQGSTEQAIASCKAAIQKNPRDLRPYMNEGMLEERRGNWQEAQKLYQQALQIKPDYPAAANNLSYLMMEHGGDKNVALSLAQTARRGLPEIPNTADTLGWAYYRMNVYNSAADLLKQAVKDSPQNPTYHYHLGLVYQKTTDY